MRLAFWRQKTRAEIIAPLTNMVDELVNRAATHNDKAVDHLNAAMDHNAKADAASDEAKASNEAAAKIAALVP